MQGIGEAAGGLFGGSLPLRGEANHAGRAHLRLVRPLEEAHQESGDTSSVPWSEAEWVNGIFALARRAASHVEAIAETASEEEGVAALAVTKNIYEKVIACTYGANLTAVHRYLGTEDDPTDPRAQAVLNEAYARVLWEVPASEGEDFQALMDEMIHTLIAPHEAEAIASVSK